MRQEINLFFTALMFYTRIPCPSWIDHSEALLEKSTKYFPLIGYIVGVIAVVVFYLSYQVLPISICIILSMLAGILTTGAFHEDGLADVCDGFGGGWSKAKILEIMKDSRIGTYGVVGLVLIMGAKYVASFELFSISIYYFMSIVFIAHTLSRLNATTMILLYEYARDDASSKTKPLAKRLSFQHYFVAFIFGIAPLLLLCIYINYLAILVVIPLFLLLVLMGRYFKKWIGGFTGDCLGSVQQVSEILIYLFMIGLWKYI